MADELNVKQKKFAAEYAKSLNATQAAKIAGYSEKTAHSQGPRLLAHVGVKKLIDKKLGKAAEKNDVTVKSIIGELAKGAFAEIDVEKMNYSDKLKCLELLSKYLGLLDGIGASKQDKELPKRRLLDVVRKLGVGSSGARKSSDKD